MEIPRPLISATYAAKQTGHFGSRANVALGNIQAAAARPRRQGDPDRGTFLRPRVALLQHCRVFTAAPPLVATRACRASRGLVFVVVAPPNVSFVASLGCAIEPLEHPPEPVQSAR